MTAIELKSVSKSMGDFELNNVNLSIPKGYVTGFIGPNGAGKSTTIHLIMGLLKQTSGTISLLNQSPPNAKQREKIGFVYDELLVYDELTLTKLKNIIAPAYKTWDEETYEKLLASYKLPKKKKIKEFSKGMKMKTSLLLALSHHPDLLIMDEPTSGLDPIFRRELIEQLQEFMLDGEKSIFFSTHITTDLEQFADYVAFIHEGKMIFHLSIEEIHEQFMLVKGEQTLLDNDIRKELIGIRETAHGFTALLNSKKTDIQLFQEEALLEKASLEDIMYFLTR